MDSDQLTFEQRLNAEMKYCTEQSVRYYIMLPPENMILTGDAKVYRDKHFEMMNNNETYKRYYNEVCNSKIQMKHKLDENARNRIKMDKLEFIKRFSRPM